MNSFNKSYWESRWQAGETGWDAGSITTPLKEYFDQLTDKSISILIPGCGNGYEAEYLFLNGFSQVYVLDIAEEPLKNFSDRMPEFPKNQLLHGDFFQHENQYDLIVEQTFFCALDPNLRSNYAKKIKQLLKPGAKLMGLLFDFPLTSDGPPFGGSKEEYEGYFSPEFKILKLERAYNSIKPRAGRELFVLLQKRS